MKRTELLNPNRAHLRKDINCMPYSSIRLRRPELSINTPGAGNVEIEKGTENLIILYYDGASAVSTIANNLAAKLEAPNRLDEIQGDLEKIYKKIILSRLTENFSTGFISANKSVRVDTINQNGEIDNALLEKLRENIDEGNIIINLHPAFVELKNDSSLQNNFFNLQISRLFRLGGEGEQLRIDSRPGTPPLKDQLYELSGKTKENLQPEKKVVLLEDNTFTGGTLISVQNMFKSLGVNAEMVLLGAQAHRKTSEPIELPINPMVEYKIKSGETAYDYIDMSDALWGSNGGYSVLLADGIFGRAPAGFPFTNPIDRWSVPENSAKEFSKRMISFNREFYTEAEKIFGQILLRDVDKNFVNFVMKTFAGLVGITLETSMLDLMTIVENNSGDIWTLMKTSGDLQLKMSKDFVPDPSVDLQKTSNDFEKTPIADM